jgi:CubicO group peptidase (beta-lactamase class C family)
MLKRFIGMTRSHYLLLIWLVCLLLPAFVTAEPVDGLENQLDPIFAEWDQDDMPGMSVAVVRSGELIYSNGFGFAQLEYDIPITPSTLFHVASVSKQFTTMAILLLEAEGKLSFDDEIQTHLPWVPRFDHPVTIRQLSNHTSGIRDQWELLTLAGWRFDDVITMADIRTMMKRQQDLNFPPLTEMLYSNMGYTLMAEIVAAVSGMTFEEYTRQNIFLPLGMTHTHFHSDHEEIDKGRSYSYQLGEGDALKKSVLSYANAGATSLFTTAEDLVLWLDNFRTMKVGDQAVMAKMLEVPVLTSGEPSQMRGEGYAGGVVVSRYRGARTIGHGGADAGFRSSVLWFPEHELGIAVLSNAAHGDPGGHLQRVADVLLSEHLEADPTGNGRDAAAADPVAVDPAVLENYTGSFSIDLAGVITFTLDGNELSGNVEGIGEFTLKPVSETEFWLRNLNAMLTFEKIVDGDRQLPANSLTLTMGEQEISGTRLKAVILTEEDAQRYTGSYYSPEIRTRIEVAHDDLGLLIQHDRHGDIRLSTEKSGEPGMVPDELRGDRWFCQRIVFTTNEDGVISGLRISGGRVRNLRFEKHAFD